MLMWLIAIGFGLPTPFVASYLLREGKLPTFFGLFPMYGGGAFERWSPNGFIVMLGLFAALSALEAFAGWLLWQGERFGAAMTIALLPAEMVLWIGFALPIPSVVALMRAALLAAGWSALR